MYRSTFFEQNDVLLNESGYVLGWRNGSLHRRQFNMYPILLNVTHSTEEFNKVRLWWRAQYSYRVIAAHSRSLQPTKRWPIPRKPSFSAQAKQLHLIQGTFFSRYRSNSPNEVWKWLHPDKQATVFRDDAPPPVSAPVRLRDYSARFLSVQVLALRAPWTRGCFD